MNSSQPKHIPVLLNETLDGLNIRKNGIYIDCTLGNGGHSSEILKRLNGTGHLYCIDQDDYAIGRAKEVLSAIADNYTIIKGNFADIKEMLKQQNVEKVDGILYDLGVSSFQLDIGERGFSYNFDAPLDMRMDQSKDFNAYDVVNDYSFNDLKNILYRYSDEKFSINIARAIEKARETKPIETTFELVEIIKGALPAYAKKLKGHPAKKTFQAIRIEVNDELKVFEKSLTDALMMLAPNGRIAVISFHSIEDRICKQLFKDKVEDKTPRGLPVKDADIMKEYCLVNSKVITASEEELLRNNRAHSAKLRVIEKL